MQIVSSVQYTVDAQYILSGIYVFTQAPKTWTFAYGKVLRGGLLVRWILVRRDQLNIDKSWLINISTATK
jgi:hypothetical protein